MLRFRRCCWYVYVCLVAALGSVAAETVPAPPGSLPAILLETDINPGVGVTRAAWIWDGRHYRATWDIGFKGEMTVESASPTALVILRSDTTGPTAGLSGKYTGKWDGHQVTDAGFSWKLGDKAMTQTWAAFAAPIPLTCEDSGHGFRQLHGWLPARPTAWVFRADSGDQTFYDKDVLHVPEGSNGIGFFQANGQRDLQSSAYDICLPHAPGHLTAAVFADGSVFGDRKLISAIEAQRGKEERQYLHVETRICELLGQGKDYGQIEAALNAGQTEDDPAVKLAARAFGRAAGFSNRRGYRFDIAGLLKLLGDRRRLAMGDPVRDEKGNLYINDSLPDATCNAPGK